MSEINRDISNNKNSTSPISSSPQQISGFKPPVEKEKEEPHKPFSWKSLIIAFFIAAFINIFVYTVNQPWTIWWMFLTIEAWKYWKWKALIPYSMYFFAVFVVGLIMRNVGMVHATWTNLIPLITLNIVGLIIFYTLLSKPRKGIGRFIAIAIGVVFFSFFLIAYTVPENSPVFNYPGGAALLYPRSQIGNLNNDIKLNPDNAEAYNRRGVIHLHNRATIIGCSDMRKACELEPEKFCKSLEDAKGRGYCR